MDIRIEARLLSFLVIGQLSLAVGQNQKPLARLVVLSNPYITTLPSKEIRDEHGSNRGWLSKLAAPSMAKSVATINQIQPDGVVILGSLTWSGSESDFAAFEASIKGIKAPVFTTPGLRDTPEGGMEKYLSRFGSQNVLNMTKTVKGVQLVFAGDIGKTATLDNAVKRMRSQTDGNPARATLIFGGRTHPHGVGEFDPKHEAFWQFVAWAKVAARFEPTRYGSRVLLYRDLPLYMVGSTAWSLRGAITHVKIFENRILVEKIASPSQPPFAAELPNPVGAPRFATAETDPHRCPSYTIDLAAKPGLSFAVVSDPQLSIGRNRKHLLEKAQKCIEDLNRLRPAHTFLPGDLVEDNLPEEWNLFNEIFADLEMPYTVMAGNHDVLYVHNFVERGYSSAPQKKPDYLAKVTKAMEDAAAEGYTGSTALFQKFTKSRPHLVVEKGGCVFICTEILTQRIEPEEVAWLRQQLEKTKSAKHVFVMGHYPVLPAFGNNVHGDKGGDAVLAMLKEFKVAAFIFGHRHCPGFQMHEGTAHVLCDNMQSSVLVHVFDGRIVIGRKTPASPLYEKVVVPEPRFVK